MNKIEKSILRLEQYPYSCAEISVKSREKLYRKLVIGKYIALYRVEEEHKKVIVFNIIYGKKDYLRE